MHTSYISLQPTVQVKCSLSSLVERELEGHLFKQVSPIHVHVAPILSCVCVCLQLLERLKFYAGFEINDQSGSSLTDHDVTEMHYKKYVCTVC